jgi:hypothetical protein
MTQAERDRLVALKKHKKKLITERQAAEEIGITERQVRRLSRKLRRKGDQAVFHELRGRSGSAGRWHSTRIRPGCSRWREDQAAAAARRAGLDTEKPVPTLHTCSLLHSLLIAPKIR